MSSSQELYVKLVNLRTEAGERLYERLSIANKLLSDRAWVDDPAGGGGDESRAIDRLEDTAFGDICGAVSLPEMLEILHRVPDKKTWAANKYNLKKMHAELRARETARGAERPTRNGQAKSGTANANGTAPDSPTFTNTPNATPLDIVRRLQAELRAAHAQIKEANIALREKDREIAKLKRAVKNLQAAFANLEVSA
jgi:hypothetical protein